MKKLWWLFALLVPGFPLFAQTGALQGHCYLGGTPATTSGANSSNYLNGIIPACTVKVYLHGTTTLATIYADGNNTPLANPFTANTASAVDPGGWIFYGVTNQGLDVVLSGGNSNPNCTTTPLCYTHPLTLSDVFPSQSFSPVSGVTSASATGPIEVNGGAGPVTGAVTVSCPTCTTAAGITSLNTMTGPAVSIVGDSTISVTANSPSTNQLQLHATGAGGSGVQYNPSTTTYLFTGASNLGDDNHILGASYTLTAYTCNGTTCVVSTSSTLPAVGDWVDMSYVNSGVNFTPTGYGYYDTNINVLKVTATGTGTFTFNYTLATGSCASSCGTAYNANYYLSNLTQLQPFFNGHGTTQTITVPSAATMSYMATNFSTMFASVPNGTTGSPVYFYIMGPYDDLTSGGANCSSVAQIEGYFQTVMADAHAKNWLVYPVIAYPPTGSSGCSGDAQFNDALINQWLLQQYKTAANTASGQYADGFVDLQSRLSPLGNFVTGAGIFTLPGVQRAASVFNQVLSNQHEAPSPNYSFAYGPNGQGLIFGPSSNNRAFGVMSTDGTLPFWVDTTQDEVFGNVARFTHTTNPDNVTNNAGTFENDYALGSGNLLPLAAYAPNLGANTGVCLDLSHTINSNYDAALACFHNVASGSTSNYMNFFLWGTTDILRLLGTGAVQLPFQKTASGTALLQIDSAGNVTNTNSGLGPIYAQFAAPISTNFTWLNQGTSASYDKTSRLVMTFPAINGNFSGYTQTAAIPATPYTVDVSLGMAGVTADATYSTYCGIVLESTGGALETFVAGRSTNSQPTVLGEMKWASATSFTSASFQASLFNSALVSVRITDDGTNRVFWVSNNGRDFTEVSTETTASFTPTNIGFGCYNSASNTNALTAYFYNYLVSTSVLPNIGN